MGQPQWTTSEAGNPFVLGWYNNPATIWEDGHYWVFAVSAASGQLTAFSSNDLIRWVENPDRMVDDSNSTELVNLNADEPRPDLNNITASTPIFYSNKYYLYFVENYTLFVALADEVSGPYTHVERVQISGFPDNSNANIDSFHVFVDDESQQVYVYLHRVGYGAIDIVQLESSSMKTTQPFNNTCLETTWMQTITYPILRGDYTSRGEPYLFKRCETYYLVWTSADLQGRLVIRYAKAPTPLGPFESGQDWDDVILTIDPAVASPPTDSRKISVIEAMPNNDTWYIVYTRRPLYDSDKQHTSLCLERLEFSADGNIQPIQMPVKPNFSTKTQPWVEDPGAMDPPAVRPEFRAADGELHITRAAGARAWFATNFTDLMFDAYVTINNDTELVPSDAGVIFRASMDESDAETNTFRGYYAGISVSRQGLVLSRAGGDGAWDMIQWVSRDVSAGQTYHLRVVGVGPNIWVFLDDMVKAVIGGSDSRWVSGVTGVRVFDSSATFGGLLMRQVAQGWQNVDSSSLL
ncbi:glycosyl hydrolase [Podospora didyma]|uniref:Glycosyl hydrolase n=1 Tax=Podospora didyma TaxID=330526 RepID=A0AAE0N0N1_9PEZI|nr:glycosyl hydrolase [Podospora didyma]